MCATAVATGATMMQGCYNTGEMKDRQKDIDDALKESATTSIDSIKGFMQNTLEFAENEKAWADATTSEDIQMVQTQAVGQADKVSDAVAQTDVAIGFEGSGEAETLYTDTIDELYSTVNREYKDLEVTNLRTKEKIDFDAQSALNQFQAQINTILGQYAGATGQNLNLDSGETSPGGNAPTSSSPFSNFNIGQGGYL
tara:strand:- start:15023 stop:15616 length:594 start_codon:yes stop_codon:yes gene_type:complete